MLNLAKMKACADATPPLEIPTHHDEAVDDEAGAYSIGAGNK